MFDEVIRRFQSIGPKQDRCTLRIVREQADVLTVRQNRLEPIQSVDDFGGMVTVHHDGGSGYAATSDLTESGLRRAIELAETWAERNRGRMVHDASGLPQITERGEYRSHAAIPWNDVSLADRIALLQGVSESLEIDDRILDWQTSLSNAQVDTVLVGNHGGVLSQSFSYIVPEIRVVAHDANDTQIRTFGGHGYARQGGFEVLEALGFSSAGPRVAEQAVQLLEAPQCPTQTTDLVLAPDQMILQIHESIGHPLELDRILGDERNYAGTSFVTPEMFGSYQYGSKLLNVSFDPTRAGEFAGYGFDDEGTQAVKEYIIKEGVLLRPLGGLSSQARAGMPGVANSRAASWNRPPIDRMANINLESGSSSFDEIIGCVEQGVYMETNCSWSIDDSRNKFQFGCEYARIIRDGELGEIVRKPNYRGVSTTFWRNLTAVGNESTVEVLGTPNCGKGEPNQVIRVGHASPTCLFAGVEVFGGA